jgi:hypothetical protein
MTIRYFDYYGLSIIITRREKLENTFSMEWHSRGQGFKSPQLHHKAHNLNRLWTISITYFFVTISLYKFCTSGWQKIYGFSMRRLVSRGGLGRRTNLFGRSLKTSKIFFYDVPKLGLPPCGDVPP